MSPLPNWCHLTWQWDDSFPCTIPWLASTSQLSLFWKASVGKFVETSEKFEAYLKALSEKLWVDSILFKGVFFVQAVAQNRVTWKGGLVPSATKSSNFMLPMLPWFVLWWTSFCLCVGALFRTVTAQMVQTFCHSKLFQVIFFHYYF